MNALRAIYEEPDEVREQLLHLFGVDEELFQNAIARGWMEWANRSEYDAPSFPGQLLWGYTLRKERQQFAERGWLPDDTGNFSTSIASDRKTAIAVETGNRFTGRRVPGKEPRTNSPKGIRTMQALSDNRALLQGNLFSGFAQARPARNTGAPLLWVHLIHQSRGDVLHEVSLPTVANDRQRIVGWECRIILPKWRGSEGAPIARTNPLQPAADSELRVVRRAG